MVTPSLGNAEAYIQRLALRLENLAFLFLLGLLAVVVVVVLTFEVGLAFLEVIY